MLFKDRKDVNIFNIILGKKKEKKIWAWYVEENAPTVEGY